MRGSHRAGGPVRRLPAVVALAALLVAGLAADRRSRPVTRVAAALRAAALDADTAALSVPSS